MSLLVHLMILNLEVLVNVAELVHIPFVLVGTPYHHMHLLNYRKIKTPCLILNHHLANILDVVASHINIPLLDPKSVVNLIYYVEETLI
jgi:hypothetical protein